ncbi:hypothetical protein ACSBR2_011972 [Camellia fascicularis]
MGVQYTSPNAFLSFPVLLIVFTIPSQHCSATDTLTQSQPISVGQTLISSGQIFELGFFIPSNSSKQYVGIWPKNIPIDDRKVVWVANRENPLTVTAIDSASSSLTVGKDGNLRLLDGMNNTVWLTNVSVHSNNSIAVLSDRGDLTLKDTVSGLILWESFNYPCDTFSPGMMLGMNTKTREKRFMSSWLTEDDPSPGEYVCGFSLDTPTQVFIWNGFKPYWRSGPWDGSKFIGVLDIDHGGCVRKTELLCEKNTSSLASSGKAQNDGFWKLSGMKLPDHYEYLYTEDSSGKDKKNKKFIISFTTISGVVLLGAFMYDMHRWRANQRVKRENMRKDFKMVDSMDTSELPIIDFDKILVATDNFSTTNKLGEGGFGPAYKGRLEDGHQVAVKRLSRHSGQGVEEFKNEIVLISKLQHRNLVRLLGCCIEGEEKLFVYEYMTNKSLDTFLFSWFIVSYLLLGYMSPEYAMRGLFSEKSDVYSLGVLLLETVSGVRNTSFHYHEKYLNLLDYDHVADRPTMSIVVFMFSNEMDLPHPKQPTFIIQSLPDADLRSQHNKICSINEASLSIIEGR